MKASFFKWSKLVADYGFAALSARVIAAVSALLLVRVLSVENYALYTLFLTAFIFSCTFSDMGATDSLTYFRRRSLKHGRDWRPYLISVRSLRSILLCLGLCIALGYFFSSTRRIGFDFSSLILYFLVLPAAAWCAVGSAVMVHVMRLQGNFRSSYQIEIIGESVKCITALLIVSFTLDFALIAVVGVLLSAFTMYVFAMRYTVRSGLLAGLRAHSTHEHRKRLILLAKHSIPVAPAALYSAVQGLLIIWLATYYATVQTIAALGALGRISAILGVLSGFVVMVITPKLSNVLDDNRFARLYVRILLTLFAVGIIGTFAAWSVSGLILSILGDKYRGLDNDLMLVVVTAFVTTLVTFMWQVSRLRGWVRALALRVPILICCQVVFWYCFDLSTLRGLLLFVLATFVSDAFLQLAINAWGFYRTRVMRPIG